MLYVGIDVSKHLQNNNNREGFTNLQSILTNLQEITEERIQIALEDTGHYCFNLLRFLRSNGYLTFSYNPLLIKEFPKHHSLRKTKTDKKVAKIMNEIDSPSYQSLESV